MKLTQYTARLQTCSETELAIKGKSSTLTIKAHTIDDAMAIAMEHCKGNQYVAHIKEA